MVSEADDEVERNNGTAQQLLQSKASIAYNVLAKRKEQLQQWELSEMNKLQPKRKSSSQSRVKFNEADVFMSACMSGDEDEVEGLLYKGANINTATVDGVTALHQAVIDGNLDIVRFLVEHGAHINAQDNEGWTPLHAAVCCGSLPATEFLVEHGADLALINSDRELAVDLAEDDELKQYLKEQMQKRGIDAERCRESEYAQMMADCGEWLRAGSYLDKPHPRTGATALHVAASKGGIYNQLIGMLLRAGADVNVRDAEGWTPLHAAAHWGERDACRILMENGGRLDATTNTGQSVRAVADKSVVDYLADLEAKLNVLRDGALQQKIRPQPTPMPPSSPVRRLAGSPVKLFNREDSTASNASSTSSTTGAKRKSDVNKKEPPIVPAKQRQASTEMPPPISTTPLREALKHDQAPSKAKLATPDNDTVEGEDGELTDEEDEMTDEEFSAETLTSSGSSDVPSLAPTAQETATNKDAKANEIKAPKAPPTPASKPSAPSQPPQSPQAKAPTSTIAPSSQHLPAPIEQASTKQASKDQPPPLSSPLPPRKEPQRTSAAEALRPTSPTKAAPHPPSASRRPYGYWMNSPQQPAAVTVKKPIEAPMVIGAGREEREPSVVRRHREQLIANSHSITNITINPSNPATAHNSSVSSASSADSYKSADSGGTGSVAPASAKWTYRASAASAPAAVPPKALEQREPTTVAVLPAPLARFTPTSSSSSVSGSGSTSECTTGSSHSPSPADTVIRGKERGDNQRNASSTPICAISTSIASTPPFDDESGLPQQMASTLTIPVEEHSAAGPWLAQLKSSTPLSKTMRQRHAGEEPGSSSIEEDSSSRSQPPLSAAGGKLKFDGRFLKATISSEAKKSSPTTTTGSSLSGGVSQSNSSSSGISIPVCHLQTPPTQPSPAKESESARKVHSRQQRLTRRSTQGVTNDQISEVLRHVSTSSSASGSESPRSASSSHEDIGKWKSQVLEHQQQSRPGGDHKAMLAVGAAGQTIMGRRAPSVSSFYDNVDGDVLLEKGSATGSKDSSLKRRKETAENYGVGTYSSGGPHNFPIPTPSEGVDSHCAKRGDNAQQPQHSLSHRDHTHHHYPPTSVAARHQLTGRPPLTHGEEVSTCATATLPSPTQPDNGGAGSKWGRSAAPSRNAPAVVAGSGAGNEINTDFTFTTPLPAHPAPQLNNNNQPSHTSSAAAAERGSSTSATRAAAHQPFSKEPSASSEATTPSSAGLTGHSSASSGQAYPSVFDSRREQKFAYSASRVDPKMGSGNKNDESASSHTSSSTTTNGSGEKNVDATLTVPPLCSATTVPMRSARDRENRGDNNGPAAAATFTLPSATPSAAKLNRRSQIVRSTRRGTGPVDMDALSAAISTTGRDIDGGGEDVADGREQPPRQYQQPPTSTHNSSGTNGSRRHGHVSSTSTSDNSPLDATMAPPNRNALFQDGPTPQQARRHRDATHDRREKEMLAESLANSQSSFEYGAEHNKHYKTLYERECQENKLLRKRIEELTLKANEAQSHQGLARPHYQPQHRTATVNAVNGDGRFTTSNGTAAGQSTSAHQQQAAINEEDRHRYERQIASLEYELEKSQQLQSDNEKLKEENVALIRVLTKLSK